MSSEIEEIRQKKLEDMKARVGQPREESTGSPAVLTDSNFEEFIGKHETVVVDCWAPWCGPCRMLSPTIDAMAGDHKGKVAFGKLNTDDNFETASKFGIMSIPTLLYFRNGKLVNKTIGALPRKMIEEQIDSIKSL